MASQAPNNQMPLFYNQLEPLSSNAHQNFKMRAADSAAFVAKVHAVPITADEFVVCQRYYPIVFSIGANPVPLALMGLNEGEKMTGVGFADDRSVSVTGTSRSGSEKTVRVSGEALQKHIVRRARKGCLLPGKIVPRSVKA